MKRKWWYPVGCAVLCAAAIVGILSLIKGYFILAPGVQFRLCGEPLVEVTAHSTYTDAGVLARKGKKDLGAQVIVQGGVDTTKPGRYTVTYRLTENGREYVQERTVEVVDREAPVLTLMGEAKLTVSARQLYREEGFSAEDRCDGDLTAQVTVQETVEGETLTITYAVSDSAGNEAAVQRVVTIRDEVAPVLRLNGYSTVYLPVGTAYEEAGCSAEDDLDGDMTAHITQSGSVDTAVAGTYTITYRVSDSAGNIAEIERYVKMYNFTGGNRGKVYLTFDDGPSSYVTPEILDVLAAHHAKATFFCVDYGEGGQYLIARMIDEGHAVGIHGYSHDYATIYANDEAFMENIYRLRDKLRADFGYEATLMRFPGGSSNTVSCAYNTGIMSRLVNRVEQEGFTYFDWNVSSGDASPSGQSRGEIYYNVTSRLQPGGSYVVLMHDSAGKQTTAEALRDIIRYAQGNGFDVCALTADAPTMHHGVRN